MSKKFNIHDWQDKQKQLSEIRAQDVPGTAAFMGKNMRSRGMSNSEKNKASVDAFFKDLRDKEEAELISGGDRKALQKIISNYDLETILFNIGEIAGRSGMSDEEFEIKKFAKTLNITKEASSLGTGASFQAGSGEGYMTPRAFGDNKRKKKKGYMGYKEV